MVRPLDDVHGTCLVIVIVDFSGGFIVQNAPWFDLAQAGCVVMVLVCLGVPLALGFLLWRRWMSGQTGRMAMIQDPLSCVYQV